jgi:hypothetical protein
MFTYLFGCIGTLLGPLLLVNTPVYPYLIILVKGLMSLAYSSATVERVCSQERKFSFLKLTKNDIGSRMRDLLMTKTKMTSVITPPKKLIASVFGTTPLITKLSKLSLQ